MTINTMNTINIGIFAHVDAGKTTITESLLFQSGAIKTMGRVDRGDTQTDKMDVEKRRGISVQATPTSINWKDLKINIIDTPGHSDFVAEVERSMLPLDGAVLVVSAKEGVQSHTNLLFNTLKQLRIPTIIFINKIDRMGADVKGVLDEMKSSLSENILSIQTVSSSESEGLVLSEPFEYDEDEAINCISLVNEGFMEEYLEGRSFTKTELDEAIMRSSRKGLVYPVLMGSALNNLGVDNLLSNIETLLPVNQPKEDEELSGIVFKINRNKDGAKQLYVRLYGGELYNRQVIGNEKVTSIKKIEMGKEFIANHVQGGDIAVITGLNELNIGDAIGKLKKELAVDLGRPTLKVKVVPNDKADLPKLVRGLKELTESDPLLEYELDEIEKDLYVNLFGNVQKEILKELLEVKYQVVIDYEEEVIIYRETVVGTGEAVRVMYDTAKPFAATIGLKVEPNHRGDGIVYRSEVSTGYLPKTFQDGAEDGVWRTVKQGLMGWELDDIIITLIEGEFNSVDSSPSDYRNLSPMVLMEAIAQAKTKLLWPVNKFELKVQENLVGRALSDLSKMKATFNDPVLSNGYYTLKGLIPVEYSNDYDQEVIAYTSGKGVYITKFHSYSDAPSDIIKTRKKIRIDPLDRDIYLLHKMRVL